MFPDASDAGPQLELESQGYAVWGSREASDLERYRGFFLDKMDELGLPYPDTKRLIGLTELRAYLQEHDGEELYIKISRWRGDMETWRHERYAESKGKLDLIAMRMGPELSEIVTFYVQKPVETDIEAGSDPYCIDGHWPDSIIVGYEKKGESYLAAVQPREEISEKIWRVNEAFTPFLKEHRYRNFFSTEVRIKDDVTSFLDPCCRCPSPAGEEQLEMYGNFGDIVWHGAHGIMVQPEYTAKFCGEAIVSWAGEKDEWRVVTIPDEIRQWFKPYACVEREGRWSWPPDDENPVIGCIVGIGDTIPEVIDHLKEVAGMMKDLPVDVKVEPISDLLTEVKEAEKEGIAFTDQKIPEPSTVIES